MTKNLLEGTRVYLSGPMDFIGSRLIEKYLGWRAILNPILKTLGIRVLDPWNKPQVRGFINKIAYGKESVNQSKKVYEKDFWSNAETRAQFERDFWETVHLDLRMCDVSDFVIAFVPTNIYSVGTVHEIINARNQRKPTLVVSPPVKYELFPEINALPAETKKMLKFYGLKENPEGIPSQWYGNIVGGNYFYDGFGWEAISIKSANFYPQLVKSILSTTKPDPANKQAIHQWEQVNNWVNETELLNLNGSIQDHLLFENTEEQQAFENELKSPTEQKRIYFWYNFPYTPKRPLLYELLSICSGIIPPRLHISNILLPDGKYQQQSHESIDDCWLIFSK